MRFISFFTAVCVGASVALAGASAHAQLVAGGPAGNPVTGKKLYEAYSCYACHGYTGETGARVLLPGRSASLANESTFISFLRARASLAPSQPSTSMPNYSATTLSEAQAKDLYAYISRFRSSPPAATDIPVFKQILLTARKPYQP